MTWVSRPVAAVVVLLVAAVAATGCAPGGSDTPTSLPPITATPTPTASPSASPSPSPTSTAGLSDEQQIKAVYLGYSTHFPEAERLPAAKRADFLATWLTPGAAADYARGIRAQLKDGLRTRGTNQSHLIRVDASSSRAKVDDCRDESHVELVSTRSHKVVRRGKKNILVRAVIVKRSVGWRVDSVYNPDRKCTVS